MSTGQHPVFAIVAHADDETIGIGGTLARHAAEGCAVYLLVLADGEGSRDDSGSDLVDARRDQCREVCRILGITKVFFESLPDNAMDSCSRLEIAKICERYISTVKPATIYTHHRGDVNIDHVLTSEAVTIAARAQPNCSVRRILHFETASSTEWQLPPYTEAFCPNWFVDISGFWEQKKAALGVYQREMRSFPHSRSIEAIASCATWRGASVGRRRAEAFMLVRSIE